MPPLAVSVTEPPAQNVVVPLGVITAVGNGLTVTICDAVLLQPLVSVTVTVYVPEALTVIAALVEPVFHEKLTPPLAVSVTEPPLQKVVVPLGVITAVGNG